MQPNPKQATNTHNATKHKTSCKYSQCNQIQNKLQMQTNTETHCKYSQCNQTQNKLQILTMQPNPKQATNTHNATKYKNKLQIKRNQTQNKLQMQTNTETHCKYSQHIQKQAAKSPNCKQIAQTPTSNEPAWN